MKKALVVFMTGVAMMATFMVGYIKGTEVPQKVASDDTIIHEYVMANYGEDYEGVINDIDVDGDNRCEFHVYKDGIYVTSVSLERYTK